MALRVGVVGCGDISEAYLTLGREFPDLRFVACADLRLEAAQRQAERHGLAARDVADLLQADDIDVVLNLTIPAAHAEISQRALEAGKHVYSEKPLATRLADGLRLVDLARTRGLRVGAAPDTWLGAGHRLARSLLDAGALGRVLTGYAACLSHGMEHWHPNPEFYFKPGAGPVFDMGPYYLSSLVSLLGPVAEVQAVAQTGFAERIVSAENSPHRGESIKVETPTSIQAFLSFVGGAQISLLMSWDVWRHGLAHIELYGETGSLRLPDPNRFNGVVEFAQAGGEWSGRSSKAMTFGAANWPKSEPNHSNYRGLGLAEMARAIAEDRPHRASGELALHALAVMEGVLTAAAERRIVAIEVGCERPAAMTEAEAAGLLSGA